MKPKVLVTEAVEIPGWAKGGLEIYYEPQLWENPIQLAEKISAYDAIIVRNRTVVNAELMAQAKNLKAIGRLGAGLDNIDVKQAQNKNIVVVYTPDANTNAVAEYCLGQMISAARKLPYANTSTHTGQWDRQGCMGRELKEMTVGIIGYGNIGKRLHEILQAFSCNVIIASRHTPADKLNHIVSLENLFSQADIISIHLEGGAATKNYISKTLLARMKQDVILINTARGDVVDEDALHQAIIARPAGSFILDVRATEPPTDTKFQNLPNVILSPHIGAFSIHAQQLVAETVFADVAAVLNGQLPKWPARAN